MTARAQAVVPTAHASRYLQQLCKHWSHKFAVEFTPEHGMVPLPGAALTLDAREDGLAVRLEGEDADTVERMKDVVSSHLDRFAHKEAPLAFDWM